MAKTIPITLMSQRGNWQRFAARQKNPKFKAVQKKILGRDKNTCRFCAFQSEKYQVIVNKDHDYNNNKAHNLVTACLFCAQCFFLDSIDSDKNMGGHVIYLPEITQADLNHFCRVLFSSMLRDAPYKGKLQTTYLSLQDRSAQVEEIFGPGSNDPASLGQTIIDSQLDKEKFNHPVMQNLRLLPKREPFTAAIAYWKVSVFDQIPL